MSHILNVRDIYTTPTKCIAIGSKLPVHVSQGPGSESLTVDNKNGRALCVHVEPYFDSAVHHVYSHVHANQRHDSLMVGALDSAGVLHVD